MCAVMVVHQPYDGIPFCYGNMVFIAELCEENAASLVKNGIEIRKLEPLEDHMVLKMETNLEKSLRKSNFSLL